MKLIKFIAIIILILGIGFLFRLWSEGDKSTKMPTPQLLDVSGRLIPCPESPNCVCSMESPKDKEHFRAPLDWNSNPLPALQKQFEEQKNVKIVKSETNYLQLEFTSKIFRFVDDVALLYDVDSARLHFRSSSRVGHSDLGANRKRIEKIIEQVRSNANKTKL